MVTLTLSVPRVTKISFLQTISIHHQEKRLGELRNDEQRRNALIFYQVLSTDFIRQFMDTSAENLYLDIGA